MKTCEACSGHGWVHAERKDGWHTIEACATCNRFQDDKTAFKSHNTECGCPWWKTTADTCQLWGQEYFLAAHEVVRKSVIKDDGTIVLDMETFNELAAIVAFTMTQKAKMFNEWRFNLNPKIHATEFLDAQGNIKNSSDVEDFIYSVAN